ncbi:MAG: T9SS type A sorting domain-containing protein [Bacteroidia bacterium]|nr:T9SS type A sorting domain-containing protein [Bacteroidia bacterium]MDW8300874.1 T9SS type A sorting domain-containing protein [Bacteroidia bacterium]
MRHFGSKRHVNTKLIVILLLCGCIFSNYYIVVAQSCASPTSISLGVCNLSFDRSITANPVTTPVPSCFNTFDNSKSSSTDGWATYTAAISGTVTLEYTSYTKDVVLAVYLASGCPTSSTDEIGCSDATTSGTERLIFSVLSGSTYRIRVINRTDNAAMNGTLCFYQGLPTTRDHCSNAQNILVGQTNVSIPIFDTNRNNENRANPNTAAPCNFTFNPSTNIDAWVRFTATSTRTRVSYTSQNNKNVAIAIYANCVSQNSIPSACVNGITTNTPQEEFINVVTTIGTTYYVRIMNLTDNNTVQGFVSIINGVFDNCSDVMSLTTSPLQIGSCNLKFTFPASFVSSPPAFPSCASSGFNNDAWTRFTGDGTRVRLEYQGNKGIAIAVYTGNNCGFLSLVADLDGGGGCTNSSFACPSNPGSAYYQKIDILTTNNTNYFVRIINMQDGNGLEGVLCLSSTPNATPKLPNNFSDPSTAVNLVVNDDCGIPFNIMPDQHQYGGKNSGITSAGNSSCGGVITDPNFYAEAWAKFNSGSNTSIVIRYDNQDYDPSTTQNNAMIELRSSSDPTTLIACANSIALEGIEELTATVTANTDYYIRIVAIGPQCTTQKALFGKICVASNSPQMGDLCSNAHSIVVGQCNITLNVPANFTFDDPTPPTCGFVPANMNDAWISFQATSNRTDITYNSTTTTNADPAFAVYVGNCGSLTLLGSCINNNTGSSENATIATVPGTTYYIRVMNVFGTGTNNPMLGKICVQQTIGSDVCDDLTLVTVPVGTCGGRLDIPINFDRTADYPLGTYNALNPLRANYTPPSLGTTCDPDGMGPALPPAVKQDAWFRINGTGARFTIHYENINGKGNPAIAVYTAPSAINCGTGANGAGNPNNELVCANQYNFFGRQTETVVFSSNPGQQYLVRVMNVDLHSPTTAIDPSNITSHIDMAGTLCFIAESGSYLSLNRTQIDINHCSTPRIVNIGDCDIPVNVIAPSSCEAGTYTPATLTCSTVQPPPTPPANDGTTSTTVTCTTGDAWARFTTAPNQTSIEGGRVTITYNNDNNSPFPAVDVTLAVYQSVNCGTSYTLVGNPLPSNSIGCSERVIEGVERVSFIAANNTTYYIRVINRGPAGSSAYGRICIFNGPNMAEDVCSPTATSYGLINGDFKQFDIEASFVNNAQNNIPNCVTAGGSSPSNPDPPIQRDAWMRFEITVTGTYTVQYDNSNGNNVFGDVPNVAIAIYNTCPGPTDNVGLIPLACSNKVWEGTESITFIASTTGNFYVRVMNVSNSTATITGKIRIAAFAQCNAGPNLIIDGDFAGWGNANLPFPFANSGNTPNGINRDANRPAENAAALQNVKKFATMYGYRQGLNSMYPEGVFTVGKTARVFHTAFFSYGAGYYGYGTNNPAYCNTGGAGVPPNSNPISHACQGYGTPTPNQPAAVPNVADANFMIINGWAPNGWGGPPPVGSPNGKVWCQTVTVEGNKFYMFTGWFANLIQIGWNIDLPQLVVTICDMQHPVTQAIGTPVPGTTIITGANPDGSGGTVTHTPPMPSDVTSTAHNGRLYGAGVRCNASGESSDYRLKLLGSDIFLPEAPDRWLPMRCIYKSPNFAVPTQVNLCIENKSLTPNGNDFAIDKLTFQECIGADPNVFNDFLKGNTCELADNPAAIGVALPVEVLTFDAKYINEQVSLQWQVIIENNISHYEVQRSEDGKDFESIGLVRAFGNLQEWQTYSYSDTRLPRLRKLYYRLKIKTREGDNIYTDVREVILPISTLKPFVLFPNPVEKGQSVALNLDLEVIREGFSLSIANLVGNVVYQQSYMRPNEGSKIVNLPTQNLPAGVYIVSMHLGGKIYTDKFTIF